MPNARKTETSSEARARGDRLRQLKEQVRSLGKRGLEDTFAAGEALEEAAGLLRGSYSSWVKTECGLEPRTALGFRKTFRVLSHLKDSLLERNVSASVAVMIASAKPDGRERALAAIESGRTLSVRDAKNAIGVGSKRPTEPRPAAIDAFARFLRQRCDALVVEATRIASLATPFGEPDETALVEIAVRARAIEPILSAVCHRTAGSPSVEDDPMLAALRGVAAATVPADIVKAVRMLTEITSPPGSPPPEAALQAPAQNSFRSPATSKTHLTSSPFRHGLKSFEICAGAGGQAAGLAKAGFRHVGLLERNPIACQTLRAAFGPEHVIEADLVDYEPEGLGDIDLLAGGVPCQPFSQSGKRKGAQDSRDMFPEALRLVERLRPRAVMLENVKGLMEKRNDTYRFAIQAELERLGYQSEWRLVDASHFGVPQKRVRAILMAFRDRDAMARFVWPTAWVPHHKDEPYPIIEALIDQMQSRGWRMPLKMRRQMNRAANTVLGGSDRKQGADLGQRNGSIHWVRMGVIRTRIAEEPPAKDHVGDVALTNQMLAMLQGFPMGWPFEGKKVQVFRQIGNAFPPPVAMHLGCAIASALTGELVDPTRYYVHVGRRSVHLPRNLRIPKPLEQDLRPEPRAFGDGTPIPLDRLRATATTAEDRDPTVQGFEYWCELPVGPTGDMTFHDLWEAATEADEANPAIQGFEQWWAPAAESTIASPQPPPA